MSDTTPPAVGPLEERLGRIESRMSGLERSLDLAVHKLSRDDSDVRRDLNVCWSQVLLICEGLRHARIPYSRHALDDTHKFDQIPEAELIDMTPVEQPPEIDHTIAYEK